MANRVLYVWTGRTPYRASAMWEMRGAPALAHHVAESPAGVLSVREGCVLNRAVTAVTKGAEITEENR